MHRPSEGHSAQLQLQPPPEPADTVDPLPSPWDAPCDGGCSSAAPPCAPCMTCMLGPYARRTGFALGAAATPLSFPPPAAPTTPGERRGSPPLVVAAPPPGGGFGSTCAAGPAAPAAPSLSLGGAGGIRILLHSESRCHCPPIAIPQGPGGCWRLLWRGLYHFREGRETSTGTQWGWVRERGPYLGLLVG